MESSVGEGKWNKRVEDNKGKSWKVLMAAVTNLGFILRVMRSHWRGSSRGMKGSNLHFIFLSFFILV